MDEPFVLKGKFSNLIIINSFGIIFGGIILYFIGKVPHYGFTFFIVCFPILIFWMLADAIVWYKRGVREMHILPTGLMVYKGFKRTEMFILAEQISDLNLYQRLNRKSLTIMLGNKVVHVSGIYTFYPGRRIYITSDAFNENDFDKAVKLIFQYFDKADNKSSKK